MLDKKIILDEVKEKYHDFLSCYITSGDGDKLSDYVIQNLIKHLLQYGKNIKCPICLNKLD